MNENKTTDVIDVAIVGAGPAGLVTLHAAKTAGLSAIAIDKGPICGALAHHPIYMRWFSTADKLELAGFPLLTTDKNPTRSEYLKYCRAFVDYFNLDVLTYREVTSIARDNDMFAITVQDIFGREEQLCSFNVVVATGFYDSPRSLGVPGEDLPKVSHRYTEPHFYAGHKVLVIGAGSSAAETALDLYRNGAEVTVAMRGDRFVTKYWIEPDIENRIAEGAIRCYRNVEVSAIGFDDVTLIDKYGEQTVVPNEFVLAMTGYVPDTTLLERVGVDIDDDSRKPILSEFLESNVPGLYIAGTLCAGCESNTVFVENSRQHGPIIIKHILSQKE
ncbi:MAG: YpdA family putative bacillithiol disulfide reductase [Candidatus Hydrogenedentes bacterium]|nr:YpdA family putative bacillithiol disulfide reductase [Candidatus Hydrogenedentota bacterium]